MNTHTRSRRSAVLFAALLACGALLTAVAAGMSDDVRAGDLAGEEVSSYATDAHVTTERAASELEDQTKLPELERAARAGLGSAYAGVWVDAGASRRIKLGVYAPADGEIPEDLRSEASAAIAACDLSDRVDLVATTRRESELVGLQHRFERELIGVNEGAPITIDAVANVVTGKVDLFVPSSAERTAAQSEWVREAQDRFGTVIRIRKSPGKLELR